MPTTDSEGVASRSIQSVASDPAATTVRRVPRPALPSWFRRVGAVAGVAVWLVGIITAPDLGAQEPADTNYDESKVPAYELPDPLITQDGRRIADAADWAGLRRPEVLDAFSRHVYGRTPAIETRLEVRPNAPDAVVFDGLAVRQQVRLRLLGSEAAPWIDLLLYIPRRVQGPAPVFLGLNYGNQGVHSDPGILPSRNSVAARGEHAHRWPLETLLRGGYAVASFHGGDIEVDRHGSSCRVNEETIRGGIRHWVLTRDGRKEAAEDEWGALGAWAWGLSRVLDYLVSDPATDGGRVAVFGHSRTGKAALWAGAQDPRFAVVISNNSGQGGAALARRKFGETVAASCSLSGSWYCDAYRRYANNEGALPVDAHLLIALMAPRPVYVASAVEDRWADPKGEFLAVLHAEPVYRLLGRPGLGLPAPDMPKLDQPVGGTLGYHLRSGDHEITAYDWARYLDFADRHLPKPQSPVHLVPQRAIQVTRPEAGVWMLDFGRVAFGNLRLTPPPGSSGRSITVHFGEAREGGRIQRKPPGSVRYAKVALELKPGVEVVVSPPPDRRNTEVDNPRHPPAVLTPEQWGVVLPFRWVEIEGWPGDLGADQVIRQAAFARTWDDGAADFHCSDDRLNRIWELCRYSIKATTFAGIYVDGDRERIAYEADAHLNQLGQYATDRDVTMSRSTFDWLMKNPTWPTEWASYMVLIAHADWMHTGDIAWLGPRFDRLKDKLMPHRTRPDGLIGSDDERLRRLDLVDWPGGERNGYVFTELNTVVNTFHLRALGLMAELAEALGRPAEAEQYAARERSARSAFLALLWDAERGRFRDGAGTDHTSVHANLFPLAFGLVPEAGRERVASWLLSRGMACSVYAAQYLLEGLFLNHADTGALDLMTADGDRSWMHMLDRGATITWEAWDQKYKPNQDWNHPWGAAPANLLPRFVLGAQTLQPGWAVARIRPHPGSLRSAGGRIPTPRGPIEVRWERNPQFRIEVRLPETMTGTLELPATEGSNGVVMLAGPNPGPVAARRHRDRWVLDQPITGRALLEVR